jgi:gluconate 2-dehydrogenase gamma chain
MAEETCLGPARENPQRISRRGLLHRCAICLGVINLPQAWTRLLAASEHAQHAQTGAPAVRGPVPFKYFTPEQAACVEAITEQIIPADQDPGARWAGVVHYIDLSLAGQFAKHRPTYQAGLSRLAELTRDVSDRPFSDLDFGQQTSILEKLESDVANAQSSRIGQEFFALVRRQTIEGFFGDPKYGGNRDNIGWKILKFEG